MPRNDGVVLPQMVRLSTAARLLGIGKTGARFLGASGTLPVHRLDGIDFVLLDDVMELKAQRESARKPARRSA